MISTKNRNDDILSTKIDQVEQETRTMQDQGEAIEKVTNKLALPTLEVVSTLLIHVNSKVAGNYDLEFKTQLELTRTLINQFASGSIRS